MIGDTVGWDRLQFAFTITFHYLFPQLTMGLAAIIFWLATQALRTDKQFYWNAAHFFTKILAIGFAAGVATGVPMEFQFGTNWAGFSRYAGSIIGQTLAIEGVIAFFLEAVFLGLLLFNKGIGPRRRWVYTTLVFVGAWISGFFIIATNAFMQHPVAYTRGMAGNAELNNLGALITNPWLGWQYAHNMSGSVITGSFVVMGIGAFYLLTGMYEDYGRSFVRIGIIAGCAASIFQLYPSGDSQGQNVARYQPVTLAAIEGLFESEQPAGIAILGQPDMRTLKLDNPVIIPRVLSFLTYRRWDIRVEGLKAYPPTVWPDHVPLAYYSYHIMVGLGTIYIGIMVLAAYLLYWGVIFQFRLFLWILLLISPFPFISNTAGWLTAELGRQPWVIYGLLQTYDGASPTVAGGNTLFTLVGFMGAYLVLGLLVLFLVGREIAHGPEPHHFKRVSTAG